MKRTIYLCIITVLAVFSAACSGGGNRGNAPSPIKAGGGDDTLYTEKAVLAIYDNDPQRALTMIDSAVLLGNIGEERATFLRATVYCNSSDEWPLDTVIRMLEGLLETDFAQNHPGHRQDVLDRLVEVTRRRYDNVAYLRWATEKADFCREQGEETEALRTEAEIGAVLTDIGEVEKGLSKIDGVIGALDKQRHFNEMDACIIALKRKAYVLIELGRSDEAIPLAKRIVEKINDYREHPDDYDDGSFRLLPNEEKRLGYCAFYTSQAYGYLTYAYSELNTLDSARHYLALFEKSDYAKTLNGKMMASSVYLQLGKYGKVLPIYDEVERRFGNDTLNNNFATILKGRAVMAEAFGDYRAANSYRKRYAELKNVLNKQLLESRAYEYAARYHLQEEEMKVEREMRKAENGRRMTIVLFVFALVAVGFIVRLVFLSRAINRKNKVLAEQLAEKVSLTPNPSPEGEGSSNSSIPLPSPSGEGTGGEAELFAFLSEAIRKEKLFTDSNFGRQAIMDRFHLSDRRVGAAFAKGSPYASVTDFTRELRLEYACQLLTERPDMSISDVAAASGFSSPIVFNRAFKAKHEITPTYYREKVTRGER